MEQSRFKSAVRLSFSHKRGRLASAFTLVEMLASLAVLALIMVILTQTFATISATWKSTTSRGSSFASARAAFETLRLNLSQATLNTYLGYADSAGNTVPLLNPSYVTTVAANANARSHIPSQYLRASELHFITDKASTIFADPKVSNPTLTSGQAVFFQAPTGVVNTPTDRPLGALLNVLGYYVAFNSSDVFTPATLQPSIQKRFRYRLMEIIQPAELNAIYGSTCQTDNDGIPTYAYDLSWIGNLKIAANGSTSSTFQNTYEHVLAENIITMALLPKLPPKETDPSTQGAVALLNAAGPTSAPTTFPYHYDSRLWAQIPGQITPPMSTSATDPDLRNRWRNQLPPLMELVIITIDEPSDQRLATLYGGPNQDQPPFANGTVKADLDLTQVFQTYQNQGNSSTKSDLDTDITTVEAGLDKLGVSYRIFRTDVAMNNSQWSSN